MPGSAPGLDFQPPDSLHARCTTDPSCHRASARSNTRAPADKHPAGCWDRPLPRLVAALARLENSFLQCRDTGHTIEDHAGLLFQFLEIGIGHAVGLRRSLKSL